MFQHRRDKPQVKRNVIFSITNLVCELPHEVPNDLRPRILGNKEILGKSQIWVELNAQPPLQNLNFGSCSQKTRKKCISNFSCPVRFYWISPFCSKYFAQDCRLSGLHKMTVTVVKTTFKKLRPRVS